MEKRNKDPDPKPGSVSERKKPLPLADRLRMVRPAEQDKPQQAIFTDWASI